MGELSFLTIIVSLAVCSILVFAVYQYMKVRFTILEHSQKEQALILQQYIEESSYDIQGLQSVVFRHAQQQQQHQQQHQPQTGGSEPEEVFEEHNKHIHMDTVMYEAPNKQRSTLIAISSDSENTTSDESESEDSGSDSGSESGSDSDSEESESESESGSESEDGESVSEDSESENVHVVHDIKHIEISIDEASPVAELPTEEITEIKTVTVDLGVRADAITGTDTIDVLSLLNKNDISNEEQDPHFTAPTASTASSASFQSLSVIELRALLKEKYKEQQPEKITNLQKLKKPELIQLLQE
jgi:hypothetical protein